MVTPRGEHVCSQHGRSAGIHGSRIRRPFNRGDHDRPEQCEHDLRCVDSRRSRCRCARRGVLAESELPARRAVEVDRRRRELHVAATSRCSCQPVADRWRIHLELRFLARRRPNRVRSERHEHALHGGVREGRLDVHRFRRELEPAQGPRVDGVDRPSRFRGRDEGQQDADVPRRRLERQQQPVLPQ